MRTFVRRNLNSSEMRRQDANAESYRGWKNDVERLLSNPLIYAR